MRRKHGLLIVAALMLAATAAGQELDTILFFPDSLGEIDGPIMFVPNPITGLVYVVNEGNDVVAFDPATRSKARLIQGAFLDGIFCRGANKLYFVEEEWPYRLAIVNAVNDSLLGRLDLPYAEGLLCLAYSPTSNKLYVGFEEDVGLVVVDVLADSVVDSLPEFEEPEAAAWDSLHDRILAAVNRDQLVALDCTSDTVVATLELPRDGASMCLDYGARRLNVSNHRDGIVQVDLDSLVVTRTVAVMDPGQVVYVPVNDRLCCIATGYVDDRVLVFSGGGDSLVGHATLKRPVQLDYSSVSGHVYVSCEDTSGVAVLDGEANVIKWLPDGERRDFRSIGLFPSRWELYLGSDQDTISVVSTLNDSVLGRVVYEYYDIRGMVYNPAGAKLYLLCPYEGVVLVVSSAGAVIAEIPTPSLYRYVKPVLNLQLNRLYLPDYYWFGVIDCNSDTLVSEHPAEWEREAIGVLVPGRQRLYIFPGRRGSAIGVYDCLLDSIVRRIEVSEQQVGCAVYHPQSGHIYFGQERRLAVGVLDTQTDSVWNIVPTSTYPRDGRMAVDTDLQRVYFANDRTSLLYTIDVLADSLLDTTRLPGDMDTLVWSREASKLYLSRFSSTSGKTYAFDCRTLAIVDSFPDTTGYAAVMSEPNADLYVGTNAGVTVIDCYGDSVKARLPEIPLPRHSAWDMAGNRMFFAQRSSWVAVYSGAPYGIEEERVGEPERFGLRPLRNPVAGAVRLRCMVPLGTRATLAVFDVTGRRVMRRTIKGGDSPVEVTWQRTDSRQRAVPSGIYFARLESDTEQATAKLVLR